MSVEGIRLHWSSLRVLAAGIISIHFTELKPVGFKPRGRPEIRKEAEIKRELKVMTICHWKMQDKTRNEWKNIMELAESSIRGLQR